MKAQLTAALALAALAAVPAGAGAADATTDVEIFGFLFDPPDVTIDAGDSVRWTNSDPFVHTATGEGGTFDTDLIAGGGGSATVTFATAGVYPYLCVVHPFMTGIVRVRDPLALPDLVVAAIESVETTPGVSTDVTVTVRNDGLGTAAASTVALYYREGDELVPIGTGAIDALDPGQTDRATITWDTLGLIGDFELLAVADATAAVAETAEDNNTGTATASVLVPGIEGTSILGLLGF